MMALGFSVSLVEQSFGFTSAMRFLRSSFLALLSLVVFAEDGDGTCYVTQSGDGGFTIVCYGNGVIWDVVTKEEIIYTYGNCEDLKSDFDGLCNEFDSELNTLSNIIQDSNRNLADAYEGVYAIRDNYNVPSSNINDVVSALDGVRNANTRANTLIDTALNTSYSLRTKVDSINCDSCPTNTPSGGGNGDSSCCNVDFTEILAKLNEAQQTRVQIRDICNNSLSVLGYVTNSLNYVQFLLSQGFGSTTNELAKINDFLHSVTNLTPRNDWLATANVDGTRRRKSYYHQPAEFSTSSRAGLFNLAQSVNLPYSYYSDPTDYFKATFSQGLLTVHELSSLNNYQYLQNYIHYPFLSNQFLKVNSTVTNFFSFFRSQLSKSSPLADFDSAQNAGRDDLTYYDFLTNHYIQVATGGTLSGDQATKTNWFSRIETLLAALVFSDAQNVTNSVDRSYASDMAERVTGGLTDINISASSQSQSLSSSSQSIIQLFTSYCDIFDSAALPSTIVLFTLSNDDGADDVVSFNMSSAPDFSFMVESMRFITTFCWSSVGILLLWKFIVWASRCVFVACRFVYVMITKTFR